MCIAFHTHSTTCTRLHPTTRLWAPHHPRENLSPTTPVTGLWLDWRLYYMGCVRFLLDCAVSGMHFWLPLLIDAIVQGSLTEPGTQRGTVCVCVSAQ